MEKSSKKKVIIIISSLVILGIGGYFLSQYLKRKKEEEERKKAEENVADSGSSSGGGYSGGSPASSGGSTPTSINSLPNGEKTKRFQQWVLDVKKDTSVGTADGVWGSKTASAWAKYGAEYLKAFGSAITSGLNQSTSGSASGSGQKIYLKGSSAYLYSYPSGSSQHLLGKIDRDSVLDRHIGIFIMDAGNGWSKIKVLGYSPYSKMGYYKNYDPFANDDVFVKTSQISKTAF